MEQYVVSLASRARSKIKSQGARALLNSDAELSSQGWAYIPHITVLQDLE